MKRVLLIGLLTLVIIAILIAINVGLIHMRSKKYNLISLRPSNIPQKQEAVEDDHVQLTDIKMHYVKYGSGEQPIILIHGNGGSCDSLKELAQYLANDYSVYCLDSRCQGKSSDPGVITYDLMSKDVYEFISLKLSVKPFVLGHSDGGIVALSLASNYPDSIKAVMSCGANSHPSKFKFYFTWGVKIMNKIRYDKLNDLMLELPNFTPEFLAKIKVPTYIVAAEFDIMPLSDSVYIHKNIESSKIAIIKWATHSSYISKNGSKIYMLAKPWFDENI
ncbi:MAG: alpha/beta hydrolase [Clostridia bacterium]|nr:alpha/beta hydrolase [Clostridia bacterium]